MSPRSERDTRSLPISAHVVGLIAGTLRLILQGFPLPSPVGAASDAGHTGLTCYFICPISFAAPLAVFANLNSASRPPAA